MKILVLLLLLSSTSNLYAKDSWPLKLAISVSSESYSVSTKETNSTVEAKASFFSSQIIPSVGFFVHEKILISAQYTQSFIGEFGVTGIGASCRYYFVGGASSVIQFDDNEVKINPTYSVFVAGTYKNLLIGAGDVDVRFNAIESSFGVERFLSDNYFLVGSFNVAHLSSSNSRTGFAFGVLGGVGYNY